MKRIYKPYDVCKNAINEADVLLFKAQPFPSIGWAITSYTGGEHSHVGLAHWDSGELYCVEQREFKGGRSVLLESQLTNCIDVYRARPQILCPKLDEETLNVFWEPKILSEEVKHNITNTALKLTGSDYGWSNIWEIFKGYAPGFRMVYRPKNGDDVIAKANVCSTVAVYSYRVNYTDPCPNLSDARTSPADIAQSSLFYYMFSIEQKK